MVHEGSIGPLYVAGWILHRAAQSGNSPHHSRVPAILPTLTHLKHLGMSLRPHARIDQPFRGADSDTSFAAAQLSYVSKKRLGSESNRALDA